MATAEHFSPVSAERDLTSEEIRDTYARLGLNDPDICRRLRQLAAAAEERPLIGNWLRADADSASID